VSSADYQTLGDPARLVPDEELHRHFNDLESSIVWQRLVSSDGKTCDRCNATYQEMLRAVGTLKEAFRIWIAGRPMEQWLGARVGSRRGQFRAM
jgi:hypothetical protein